jgi:N-acetylglutamate synthase
MATPNTVVRQFVVGDCEAACSLWNAVEGVEICEGDSREEIGAYLARNPGLSCVAEENGALVGAALCGHDGRRGFLYHLAVQRSARGRGIAGLLLAHCLRGWRDAGIKRAIILVADDNSLGREFWLKHGWESVDGASAMATDV